jgi:hypothetical protein
VSGPAETDPRHVLPLTGPELDELVTWLDHARDYLETIDTPREELRRLEALLAMARRVRQGR